MKIAILSDLHANLPALLSVLDDLATRGVEQFWCLGDMVGYYADPVEPLMFVKRNVDDDDWVLGNHDAMLADLILPGDEGVGAEMETRGEVVRARGKFLTAQEWQQTNATPIQALKLNRAELDQHAEASAFWQTKFTPQRAAPRHKHINGRDYLRVHASQHSYIGRYLYSWQDEILLPKEFEALRKSRGNSAAPQTLCFGHTHVPTLVYGEPRENGFAIEPVFVTPGKTYPLGERWALLNPGSVGQSRDGDRRASYALLDPQAQTVAFIRVEYPYRETASRLLQKGYPEGLARKLLEAPPVREMPQVWKEHHARNGAIAP